MTETAEIVWNGPEALRPFLVPLDSLEPFPGNPRRGDVESLRTSLRRWGQPRPILVDPDLSEGDLRRVVAGHHLALAAASIAESFPDEPNWTHIAAIPNRFADEDEARAYLIADNRLPELGGYDDAELAEHLRFLRELDLLDGTGYTDQAVDDHLAELRRLSEEPSPSHIRQQGQREHRDSTMKELVLLYNEAQFEQADIWLGMVAKERGTHGPSETIYAALEIAARAVNG